MVEYKFPKKSIQRLTELRNHMSKFKEKGKIKNRFFDFEHTIKETSCGTAVCALGELTYLFPEEYVAIEYVTRLEPVITRRDTGSDYYVELFFADEGKYADELENIICHLLEPTNQEAHYPFYVGVLEKDCSVEEFLENFDAFLNWHKEEFGY